MSWALNLSEYVFEPLRTDGEFVLYRATDSSEHIPPSVLVLAPASERPSLETLKKIEHECSLRDELDPAWAVRPLGVCEHRRQTVLALEDPGGETLDRSLSRPMETTAFLRCAIGLAAALGGLHGRRLIHKDVKPANVLINPVTGQTRLLGFGIASRLPRERQAPQPPETIAGTLPYMAPEQTGRMNRSIDARSDLYAFGVTLYEMLTGSVPFTAADPMEWVHCHVARRPIPPSERVPHVPAAVSGIVMKLLAKSAEDRYQTAAAAEKDLRRCLVEWEADHRIEPFALGAADVPSQLVIPETLYGRETEVATLEAAFDRVVASGTSELVLVTGYSGIGKSTVVHELHRALVPPRGLFASGKFDQYRRDIPYSTFAQAFQQLVHHILGQSDAEIAEWRRRLAQALAGQGKLVLDLISELEFVIGPQPDVVELPPQEARKRFQRTLLRFAAVFARREHPLVLFVDDLQWLDAASLDLLVELITDDSIGHLLVLGAYRDNEVGAGHPLIGALEAIRARDARVIELALAALQLGDVTALLSDALHADEDRVRPLATLVHDKTGGNPFFVIQFVTALADDSFLSFDPAGLTWVWDIEQIRGSSFTENVVHLMVDRLSQLAGPTRAALSILACLGHSASLATLGAASELGEDDLHSTLWPGVRSGLIFRHEASYAFLHDRVQEAAYSLLAPADRPATHLMIGRRLLASCEGVPDEKMFEIAGQLNRGAALIGDLDERRRLAELDLAAARRARASGAYASAGGYLTCASELLPADAWDSCYTLARDICFERASCNLLGASFGAAEALIVEMLDRCTSNVDRSRVYRLDIELAVLKSEFPRAVERALECLRQFGIGMSAHPQADEVEAAYALVFEKLGQRPIQSLIDLPRSSDEEFEAAMAVLGELYVPAIFTDAALLQVHLCHMVALTLDRGVTAPATNAFGWFGVMLGAAFDRCQEGLRFGKLARELVALHGFAAFECKTLFSLELVSLWTSPLDDALDAIRACRERGLESGDISVACAAHNHIVSDRLARGDALDAIWPDTERGVAFARRAGFQDVVDLIVAQQRFIRCMQGWTTSVATFGDAEFDEAAFEEALTADRMVTMVFWYWVLKGQARFIAGEHDDAARAFDRARPLIAASPMHIQNLDFHYFDALNLAALDRRTPEERERIEKHRAQLACWVESYPPTFADKERLVAAELARLDGADLDAMRLYEDAIRLARQNGFTHNEAIASEVCARFYADRGFERIAFTYRENARAAYERWGAVGKVRQLESWYPNLRTPSAMDSATIRTSVEHLDLATVIKVASAVTTETLLNRLIESLMRTAIEHAGAERALLVLSRGAERRIAAEAITHGNRVSVQLLDEPVTASKLPETMLRYALHTKESVILDDAAILNRFSPDPYIGQRQVRSVLCLPLSNQAKLIGVLYLENNLAPRVFAPARLSVLKVLASQAAISLENARLYADLAEREARIRRLGEANIIGIVIWNVEGRILEANDAFLKIVGYDREALAAGRVRWTDLTPPEWQQRDEPALAEVKASGSVQPYEKEFFRKDGSRVPALVGGALFQPGGHEGVAFVLDLSEQKRAEAEIRALKDQLYKENLVLRDEVDRTSMFEEIVGTSAVLQPVLTRVAKVAGTDSTVLITGETGTGKELVARAIHKRSPRGSRAFVSVNCAAVPRELIASELFGHEKGAFTGATQRRLGRFELAQGGTIFLDEVGDLPIETQVALLRVLQERQFERVGGSTSIRVDVRVIAATNRDLQAAIEVGTFRSDLFYRLNVFPIAVPALRERSDDISLLVEYFIDRYARKAGKTIRRINKRTLDHLRSYPWPGNVRELQNVIERSVIVCDTDEFTVDESWLSAKPAVERRLALSGALAAQEKALIEEALRVSGGRVFGPSGAAARLGVARTTLESKIRALGINKSRFRQPRTKNP